MGLSEERRGVARKKQTTFMGDVIERYYCIHCNWMGFDPVKTGEHELCPRCEWVAYSDSEVREGWLGSNCYPRLTEKYNKIHKIRSKGSIGPI